MPEIPGRPPGPAGMKPSPFHQFVFVLLLVAVAITVPLAQIGSGRKDTLRRRAEAARDRRAAEDAEWREGWKKAHPLSAEVPPRPAGPDVQGADDPALAEELPSELSLDLQMWSLLAVWALGVPALVMVILVKPGQGGWRMLGIAAAAAGCATCTLLAFILCLALTNPFASLAFRGFLFASPVLLLGILVTAITLKQYPARGAG